jgi:hypothetical protein
MDKVSQFRINLNITEQCLADIVKIRAKWNYNL